ncbi:hypothetical protein C8R45DRAFT_1213195 [Mycena sanguinolenta]|nr:hypothetical protein C8R45DRAFT_1213195 [Mycena sanguinolenta]
MHASLRMSRLVELPPTVHGVATAAANGSFQDFQRLRQIIFVEKSHSPEAVLPVIYRCLDPQKIPTIDELAPRKAVSVAALALKTLFIPIVPAGAGSDLWPRVWAWFQFLDTHRPNKTEMKHILVKCACRLRPEERLAILNATQGLYTIVGRAWASLADGTDVELNTLRYVSVLLTTMDISNLEELKEGVGGGFESLAALAVRHLDLPRDAAMTELRLDLLRNVLIFAARVAEAADDGDGPPNSARALIEDLVLAGHTRLMRTLRTLSLTTDPDPAWAIDSCFSFLLALFGVHKMHGVLPAAIHLGLIEDILLCAHRESPLTRKLRANLMSILRHLFYVTVYAEVLGTINDRMLMLLSTTRSMKYSNDSQILELASSVTLITMETESTTLISELAERNPE